jgi:cbb3-type cytochrome c oxidase subunit III
VRKILLLLGALALLSGCGTGGKASSSGTDQTSGQKLFQAKCGGCHVLAAAGSQGTTGPNLDDAFGPPRKQGFEESTIQNVVLDQIRQPSPPMPKNLVTGQDAQNVAAFVASVAGKGAPSGTPSPQQLGNDGKKIFESQCSSCHTLKAANATGTVGPNLDQLKPSQPVVEHQVEVGGGGMPAFKGKLSDAQISAVAKFVADNAGK